MTADSVSEDNLLRKFVPPYALSATRATGSGIRDNYSSDHVVIFFSDVVGFSSIAEQISPDQTAELVRKVLDVQGDAIERHGGEIDKFIGDAVMAYWVVQSGSDQTLNEACSRALSAAIAAVEGVNGIINPADGSRMRVRIGMHVGTAYSGNFGSTKRNAFTFIGSDVNAAARLEQAKDADIIVGEAKLGAIRVSASFHRRLPGRQREQLPWQSGIKVKTTSLSMHSGDIVREGEG
jgi:class 3 adenylate cyclase